MTRRKPTPAESLCKPESCFYCHHVMGIWEKNTAPDHFTKSDEWSRACKFEPLKPVKISHVCPKFTTCYYYHTPDEFKYPFVVSMGGVKYAFDTKDEYEIQKKIWLKSIGFDYDPMERKIFCYQI